MGVYSYALKGLRAGGKKLFDLAKSQGDKGSKTSTTIVGTTPKVGSLTKRREDTEAIFRARQRHGVSPNKKVGETVKKVSKLNDEIDAIRNKTSKAKGGRIGLKRGTGLMKKKSDVQKIKETFAPRVSRNKKASKFGMLSVKAGIDKNPNPTQADRIAGAKMKNKKRFV